MTCTPNSPEPLVSLDTVFTPPSRQQWVEMAVAGLGGDGESDMDALLKLRKTTLEGIPLEVLYDTTTHSTQLAINSSSTHWDNRACLLVHDDTETSSANTRLIQALQGGVTSVELHVQSPDHVPLCLAGTQLDLAPVSIRSLNHYAACTDAFVDFATQQGANIQALRCALNADPVGTALSLPVSANTSVQTINSELAEMANFAISNDQSLPNATSVLVNTAIHHNAGASTVEEIHAALATATLYLEALSGAGMSVEQACKQIVFQVAMDADILLGVAKLRAIRALWQRVTTSLDTNGARLHPTVIVAETSQRFTSLLEPWNNHLRNLSASTAAALGGADTLLVHPHDILQRHNDTVDTDLGDRMARNIAIILERECGLLKVRDPMAGSYAIENLTQQLMQHSWESLASTDTGEGWLNELVSGRWQTRLTQTHHQRITLMEQEQCIAIGVNRFVSTDELATTTNPNAAQSSPCMLTAVRDSTTFELAAPKELKS